MSPPLVVYIKAMVLKAGVLVLPDAGVIVKVIVVSYVR